MRVIANVRFHLETTLDFVAEEMGNFEAIVPYADEATMVLKAHLLIEQSLWKFIAARIKDEALVTELRGKYSPVATGKALVQLARAVAARDEGPITNGDTLWPALLKLNDLRNTLVHELEPSRDLIRKPMLAIVRTVLGESSRDLNREFYGATMLLLGYLAIDRAPSTAADFESEI